MYPDKFIDGFIRDVIDIGEIKTNKFFIRGHEEETNFISKVHEVTYIGHSRESIESHLSILQPEDVIIVHWYDTVIADMLISKENKLVVFFWGGELYEDPFWFHFNWLFDNKTKALIRKIQRPKIQWSKNPYKFFKSIYNHILSRYKTPDYRSAYNQKLAFVQRIDYLILLEKNFAEESLIRKLYPASHFKIVHSFYDTNYELSSIESRKKCNPEKIKLLLGNSATYANNHLDAFNFLRDFNGDIFCPLSYGDEYYRNIVIKEGKKKFGNRFHPIVEFMDRKSYAQFLSEIDIVLMFHNRQQAWGNIAMSLTLGKPVFLKRNNPLSQFIKELGITVYDANEFKSLNLKNLIERETSSLELNRKLLSASISRNKRLNDLSNLVAKFKQC